MSKHTIIALSVAVIIVLGAGAAFVYSQSKNNTETKPTTSEAPTSMDNEKNSSTSTLMGLLADGKTTKCTFNVDGENGQSNGTVYISGNKARADFTVKVDNKNTTTYMIKDSDTFYMWGDSLKTGIKMVMSLDEMTQNLQDNQDYAGIDPKQEIDYKCTSWTLDNTKFTPPTTIKFVSFDNMVPSGIMDKVKVTPEKNVTGTQDNSSQCAICNQLTGEAKNTCLTQLNCN